MWLYDHVYEVIYLFPLQWVHLCVGVASLVELLFRGSQFKTLEGISVGGTCRLRRIFTLQTTPEEECSLTAIPKAFHISSVVIETQAS